MSHVEYPKGNEIVKNNIYVDDCIFAEQSEREARADELEVVFNRGGFVLKGITFSNQDLLESLSDYGESINVAEVKWFLKDDVISLDIKDINFAKKIRGRKRTTINSIIPSKLTRRDFVSKVCEILDITGKITRLTAAMKLDLYELLLQKLDWYDKILDNLQPIWESRFQMMNEIKTLKY